MARYNLRRNEIMLSYQRIIRKVLRRIEIFTIINGPVSQLKTNYGEWNSNCKKSD